MNKTININLGKTPFTIDDNAYRVLSNYINRLQRIGLDQESIEDIETRIAELFSTNLKNENRNIVSLQDVDNSIAIIGRPEDFQGQNTLVNTRSRHQRRVVQKKLMRDGNDKVLGGVISGITKYFGYESPTVFRVIMFLLPFLDLWFLGISSTLVLLTYIALWIILPKATTAQEQSQMRGEPINFGDIEQQVKDSFNKL